MVWPTSGAAVGSGATAAGAADDRLMTTAVPVRSAGKGNDGVSGGGCVRRESVSRESVVQTA